jgi:hypothetical protein
MGGIRNRRKQMILTKQQRHALHRVWLRTDGVLPYRVFRRGAHLSIDKCVMIEFCGMWLGIETDGYTHS